MVDIIGSASSMNNFSINPSPFGVENPFAIENRVLNAEDESIYNLNTGLWKGHYDEDGAWDDDEKYTNFNAFLERLADSYEGNVEIRSMVENLFYCNQMGEYDKDFGEVISRCRYLVCLTHGFYGLSPRKDGHGEFIGFNLHDIGATIPNID